METTTTALIYIHAFFGTIGLLAGSGSMYYRKGSARHRWSGRWFSWGMLISSILSLIIARMPGHRSEFLFCVGAFTVYMILSGNRALRFKPGGRKQASPLDWVLSGIMIGVSAWMIGQGTLNLLALDNNGLLNIFFGLIGLSLSLGDLRNYTRYTKFPNLWLKAHIGRIMGAYIASVTAFVVAGLHWNGIFFWMAPAVLGNFYIAYWIRRVGRGQSVPVEKG